MLADEGLVHSAAPSPLTGYIPDMSNPFGIALDQASLRWAAAEGVSETVIAAVSLLHSRRLNNTCCWSFFVVASRALMR